MSTRNPPRSWAEDRSDADHPTTGVLQAPDGSMHHVVAEGSVADQLGFDVVPLTRARNSANAATRNQAAYGSYGAAKEGPHERAKVDDGLLSNGATTRQDRLESYDQDLYGNGD
jgi:hypothetical protein